MDKILEFLTKYSWKQWLTFVILCIAALLSSLFLTSCGLINRSSASGSRKVEKTVIQEQEWNIPSNTQTSRVITSYKRQS